LKAPNDAVLQWQSTIIFPRSRTDRKVRHSIETEVLIAECWCDGSNLISKRNLTNATLFWQTDKNRSNHIQHHPYRHSPSLSI
jgi:hypothetical protein